MLLSSYVKASSAFEEDSAMKKNVNAVSLTMTIFCLLLVNNFVVNPAQTTGSIP